MRRGKTASIGDASEKDLKIIKKIYTSVRSLHIAHQQEKFIFRFITVIGLSQM